MSIYELSSHAILLRVCLNFVLLASIVAWAGDCPYTLMADAGSTGTRMYMFHLEKAKLDIKDLGKGAALSSFQDKPGEAHVAVKKLINDASALIPKGVHAKVPVMIFATAGMRLVEPTKASAVYDGLRSGLLDSAYPFDQIAFDAKTISGREEGVYAFLAANYLSDHIDADLQTRDEELMGVLDLGGSSTQIAIPPALPNGRPLLSSLGEKDMYVQSFLSLGMERMRQLTYRTIVQDASHIAHAVGKIPNPCAFVGQAESVERWYGTGDAERCEHLITKVLRLETHSCRAVKHKTGTSCLPMRTVSYAKAIVKQRKPRFFMISGYVFVVDFARWFLEKPGVLPAVFPDAESSQKELLLALARSGTFKTPTISELRAAAAVLCAGPWDDIIRFVSNASSGHKFTKAQKAGHRCFELNYIISLLSVGYGFPDDERLFTFVDAIGGKDVEWSLGAFLFSRSKDTDRVNILENASAGSRFKFDTIVEITVLVPAVLLIFLVIVICMQRRGNKTTCVKAVTSELLGSSTEKMA